MTKSQNVGETILRNMAKISKKFCQMKMIEHPNLDLEQPFNISQPSAVDRFDYKEIDEIDNWVSKEKGLCDLGRLVKNYQAINKNSSKVSRKQSKLPESTTSAAKRIENKVVFIRLCRISFLISKLLTFVSKKAVDEVIRANVNNGSMVGVGNTSVTEAPDLKKSVTTFNKALKQARLFFVVLNALKISHTGI